MQPHVFFLYHFFRLGVGTNALWFIHSFLPSFTPYHSFAPSSPFLWTSIRSFDCPIPLPFPALNSLQPDSNPAFFYPIFWASVHSSIHSFIPAHLIQSRRLPQSKSNNPIQSHSSRIQFNPFIIDPLLISPFYFLRNSRIPCQALFTPLQLPPLLIVVNS